VNKRRRDFPLAIIEAASNSGLTVEEMRELFEDETGIYMSKEDDTKECAHKMKLFKDWLRKEFDRA